MDVEMIAGQDSLEAKPGYIAGAEAYEVSLLAGRPSGRAQWEQALLDAGRPLPLFHRAAWAAFQAPEFDSWFLAVRDRSGGPCGGVALQVVPSRALPGHFVLRCERFGPGLPRGARRGVLKAIIALARERLSVLRLHIETFAFDADERKELEALLHGFGLERVHSPRCYEQTLVVPLEGDEEEIFAALHRTARRHIRAVEKNPIEVRSIENPADFPRLNEISRETYARTGGAYQPPDWSKVVELCRLAPTASRLVGLYRTDVQGPSALLAFAWGCGHGDHVHYSRAASTRATDLRVPLMYPVVWDLIRWAKRNGATAFDFGGITQGSHESADPLGGISDFKRYFSEQVLDVGAEWMLEPRPLRARAARMVSATSALVSRVLALT